MVWLVVRATPFGCTSRTHPGGRRIEGLNASPVILEASGRGEGFIGSLCFFAATAVPRRSGAARLREWRSPRLRLNTPGWALPRTAGCRREWEREAAGRSAVPGRTTGLRSTARVPHDAARCRHWRAAREECAEAPR
eukprot:5076973-Prymnesium_polylepis.1